VKFSGVLLFVLRTMKAGIVSGRDLEIKFEDLSIPRMSLVPRRRFASVRGVGSATEGLEINW